MELLRKCAGFKVLRFFLTHPSEEVYLKELSLKLKISISSTKIYCDDLTNENIILEKKRGNLRLFRLNRDDFAVRNMTKAFHLLQLKRQGVEKIAEGSASLAIYGSFAFGDFDEKSDLDLLVVGDEAEVRKDLVLELQSNLCREVQLTVIPPIKWEIMKKDRDRFAESVLRNHVLVKGTGL